MGRTQRLSAVLRQLVAVRSTESTGAFLGAAVVAGAGCVVGSRMRWVVELLRVVVVALVVPMSMRSLVALSLDVSRSSIVRGRRRLCRRRHRRRRQ